VNQIIVSEILVTIDGLHALSQLRSEPLGRRQVEIADCFMITKLDGANDGETAKLLATLHAINPGAAMFGSIKGSETPLPSFEGIEPEDIAVLSDDPDRPPIFPAKIHIDEAIDWTAFSVWLSALLYARGDDIVRVKGVVRTPAGRLLVQTVRKIVQSPEILPEQDDRSDREDGAIVVIGRGYEADDLTRSLRYFAGTEPPKT
jgi:G3E family GTPase